MAADGRRLAAALALSLGLGGAFALVAWWRRRPSRRARWAASDLAALHLPPGFLFVYKQFDLHLDHPTEPVTLQAQLCTRYAGLRDATTRHGFRLIHQLDYATSGVLAVGLDKKAAASGAKVFAERRACKYYLALVHGHVQWESIMCNRTIGLDPTDPRGFRMAIDGTPGKHSGSASTALWTVCRGWLADGRPVTKLLLKPKTGRRHQLRLHCLCLGHGIVGDVAYTGDTDAERMMLHAWVLQLPLPQPYGTVTVETSDPFPLAWPADHSGSASAQHVAVFRVAREGAEVWMASSDIEEVKSLLMKAGHPDTVCPFAHT